MLPFILNVIFRAGCNNFVLCSAWLAHSQRSSFLVFIVVHNRFCCVHFVLSHRLASRCCDVFSLMLILRFPFVNTAHNQRRCNQNNHQLGVAHCQRWTCVAVAARQTFTHAKSECFGCVLICLWLFVSITLFDVFSVFFGFRFATLVDLSYALVFSLSLFVSSFVYFGLVGPGLWFWFSAWCWCQSR